jgi:DnaJ-domain-containing protein 1
VAIGTLIMLVLAAFAFVRQREQARLSLPTRDLASLSLEGGLPAASVRVARPWSGWGDAMPSTREEALRVLGVTADASETAIKKVVDGLRLSWHPDYAIDADDLEVRELRTKQVNAAWDIIRGKRAAA